MLANDVSRCLGIYTSELGDTRCERRETCARYVERHSGGERTPFNQWCCPTLDDYFGAYVPVEGLHG